MSKKFEKNRLVDWRYLHVPIKYLTRYRGGANCDRAPKYREETYEEWKEKLIKWYPSKEEQDKNLTKEAFEACKEYEKKLGIEPKKILVDEGRDKTLCILDFYGKHRALIAWRNNNTCKVGMTQICPMFRKGNNWYIKYRGKDILISDNSGWVL